MSLANELRDLMRVDRPQPGRVVWVSGDLVRVATTAGQVEVAHEGNLRVGDQVVVQNGRAVKRQRGVERVFHV